MSYASSYMGESVLAATSPPDTAVLTLTDAYRLYGSVVALAPVTLTVDEAAVCLVCGPNGGVDADQTLAMSSRMAPGGDRQGMVTRIAVISDEEPS